MSIKQINEGFRSRFENVLRESCSPSAKDELRSALEDAAFNLSSRQILQLKAYEIAFQDAIEKLYPDNMWWEITDCNIYGDLLAYRDIDHTIDEIINQLKCDDDTVDEAMMMPADSDKEVEMAKDSNGNKLVYKKGLGYSVFNSHDVSMGGFDEIKDASGKVDHEAAKKKFMSGNFNESKSSGKERVALKEDSEDFSIHREAELKKLGNGDAYKFLRDTPHPLLHDILDYIYDEYDEHIGYGRHSEHSYRDGEYYIELATNEYGHGAPTDLIKKIDRDVRNVFGDKCITAVIPQYPGDTDHTGMMLYVNDIVVDDWSSKYEGARAIFHVEDFDWDEDTDLMNELDGEVCTIKWLSIDNDNFKDSYWEIDFEDGTHFDAISGYALDVLGTPKNEPKSIKESAVAASRSRNATQACIGKLSKRN